MRTKDEVLARIEEVASDDFFGSKRDVLLQTLDFETLREFLTDDADLVAIEEAWTPTPFKGDAEVEAVLREYMKFAWGKVQDHRGLSASRSVDKLSAMVWLLGRDDVITAIEEAPYVQYGAPKLRVICEAFGLPIPDDDATQRMTRGQRCTDDCDGGCG